MKRNKRWADKKYWLVGASEGLGRSLAHELSNQGCQLVLSGRSQDRLNSLVGELRGNSMVVPCDVRDPDSVRSAAELVGDIDGLIYLAAVYEPMRAQNWQADAVVAMCDVNFTGAARVIGEALPRMLKNGVGQIALIGSLATKKGLPNAIGYGASKAGLAHLAETLHADLFHEKISVQLVNPGFIKTRLTDKNNFAMPFLMTPEDAARRTRRALENRRFRTDFPKRLAIPIAMLASLPDFLYFRIISPRT